MPIKRGMTQQDAVLGQKMLNAKIPPEEVCKKLKIHPDNFAMWMEHKDTAKEKQKEANKKGMEEHTRIMNAKHQAGTDIDKGPAKPKVTEG